MKNNPRGIAIDAATLTNLSRAQISDDGESIALAFRDAEGGDHGCVMSFEDLSRIIVQLLAAQKSAGSRRNPASETPQGLIEKNALLPFPLKSWGVGMAAATGQFVMRFTSDNDLIWDFQMPPEAATTLARDLVRARAHADEMRQEPDNG